MMAPHHSCSVLHPTAKRLTKIIPDVLLCFLTIFLGLTLAMKLVDERHHQ